MNIQYAYYLAVLFGATGRGGLEVRVDSPIHTYADVVELRHKAARQMNHPADDIVIVNYIRLDDVFTEAVSAE